MTSPQTQRSGPPPPTEARSHNASALTKPFAPTKVAPATVVDPALIEAATRLVRTVAEQAAAEEDAYQRGQRDAAALYRAMFGHGCDVGYRRAEHDEQERWSHVARDVLGTALSPSHTELEARRYPGYTREQLLRLRDRARYPLPDRECPSCGRTVSGGAA